MKRKLAFIHTSPAAIPPLMDYYKQHAPEFEITNLLDDGILRSFATEDAEDVERRLTELIRYAIRNEGVELGLVTCSAVTQFLMAKLAESTGIPLLKIDDELARRAVECGSRLGVLVTFPPTQAVTERLLRETAASQAASIKLRTVVVPDAYDALLSGRSARHDELLLAAIEELQKDSVDAIVLAQVSMARVLPGLSPGRVPVLSSLPLSLQAIRQRLAE